MRYLNFVCSLFSLCKLSNAVANAAAKATALEKQRMEKRGIDVRCVVGEVVGLSSQRCVLCEMMEHNELDDEDERC